MAAPPAESGAARGPRVVDGLFPPTALCSAAFVPVLPGTAAADAPYAQRLALYAPPGALEAQPGQAAAPPLVVACGTSQQLVAVFALDRHSGAVQQTAVLAGHAAAVQSVSFVPAAGPPTLVSASADGRVGVWDVGSQALARLLVAPGGKPAHAAACNGEVLAVGTDGPVLLWDAASGAPLAALQDGHTDDVTQVAFHPLSPKVMLTAGEDGLVNVYNLAAADADDALEVVLNIEQPVARLGFYGPRGEFLYVLSGVETLSLWHIDRGERVANVENIRALLTDGAAVQIDYLVDCFYDAATRSLFLAAGTFDGLLVLFLVRDSGPVPVRVLRGHTGVVRDILWCDTFLVTCGEDGRVCVFSWEPRLVAAASAAAAAGGAPQ